MSEFRSYLDRQGSVISQNPELAAYFALPYIPDPAKHPSFQNLFLVRFSIELPQDIISFSGPCRNHGLKSYEGDLLNF